ncbi:hypothetical protein C4N20_00360 [Fusobacterium ulcerans]|nr:hypothetical protein [Fusobacterium ulcerans]AVQ26596.1 hypothetical protein C4N20_00360 [Fusobacterium ulcerans]
MTLMIPLSFAGATDEEIEEDATKFFTALGTRSDLKYIETNIVIREEVMDVITGNVSKIFK